MDFSCHGNAFRGEIKSLLFSARRLHIEIGGRMCIDDKTTQQALYNAMRGCSIFDGIAEEFYPNVLKCLHSRVQIFEKDETLIGIGENCPMSGIVLSGSIAQTILDEDGNQINISHVKAGEVFGADRAVSGWTDSVTELRAINACRIIFLDFAVLLLPNTTNCPNRAKMTTNLLRDMARNSLFLNQRIQIMGQKKLRDKLKIYMQTLHINENGTVLLPFSRHELADYLYVDRSALSRELGRMRSEGILDFCGRSIVLHHRDFLRP